MLKDYYIDKVELQSLSIPDALKLLSLTNRKERTGKPNIKLNLVDKNGGTNA